MAHIKQLAAILAGIRDPADRFLVAADVASLYRLKPEPFLAITQQQYERRLAAAKED